MEKQHPVLDKLREKGYDFEFKLKDEHGRDLFNHNDGWIVYDFEYRGEDRTVVVPLKANDPLKRAWNRFLRMVREDKRFIDDRWENGAQA